MLILQLESAEEEGKAKNKAIYFANVLRSVCCFYTLCMIYLKLKYRKVLKHIAGSLIRDVLQVILSIIPLLLLWDLKNEITDELLCKGTGCETNHDYHAIARKQILITYIDGLCI